MEPHTMMPAVELLVKTLGSAGIAVAAAWMFFRSYQSSVEGRIAALEKASEECIKDRERLHDEMHSLTKGVLAKSNEVIHENNKLIEKVTSALAGVDVALDSLDHSGE